MLHRKFILTLAFILALTSFVQPGEAWARSHRKNKKNHKVTDRIKSHSSAPTAVHETTAILVDKGKNKLLVVKYLNGKYETLKEYHVTTGKVKGDKETEADLKTPEGIYFFKNRLAPPKLAPKYGALEFPMDYPNCYDRIAGRTGFGVALHATNEPERLKKDFDSEGCVVVQNEEVLEIAKSVRLALTPILIFQDLTPEYLTPGQSPKLKSFFENWIHAWESKNPDQYIESYHTDFSAQGMNKDQWKKYKGNLNSRYKTISVGPEDVRYYTHPKYTVITFTQNYHSTLKGGGTGHRSRGSKILYVAEESGQPKIIAETYTTLMW